MEQTMLKFQEASTYLNQILNTNKIPFRVLKPSVLKEVAGVYIVGNQTTGEIIYVGRTVNLRRRIYTNHLMGNIATARLKKYLVEDQSLPLITTPQEAKTYLQEHCYVQYIEIDDWKLRGFIEGAFLYPLNVRYIEREH